MQFWLKQGRFIIYIFSLLLAFGVFLIVRQTESTLILRTIRLTEWYGLLSLGFLYLALLITPLYRVFPQIPARPAVVNSRRALGLSCFFFALLHSLFGFFGLLGGFAGVAFLSASYLVANGMALVALIILAFMAATSFDYAVRALGKRWKFIHRFVYLAGTLILIHTLLLGAHFFQLNQVLPGVVLVLVLFLLILQALRVSQAARRLYPIAGKYALPFSLLLIAFLYFLILTNDIKHLFGFHVHA